jgi:hypothetical protein
MKEMKDAKGSAKADATSAAATPVTSVAKPAPAPETSASPAASTSASVTAGTSAQGNATAKQPEPQQVAKIKEQHASFRAQPRPDRVPAVTFSAGYQIRGADQWQGPQYEVYRSYRPERHDRSYFQSRYQRVELVAGGS